MIVRPLDGAAAHPERRVQLSLRGLLLLVGIGLCAGLAVAVLAARYGPWLPATLAVIPPVLLAGFARPVRAMALVLAAMPVGAAQVWLGPYSVPVIQIVALSAVALTVSVRLVAGRAPLLWPNQMWWAAALTGIAVLETPLAVDPDAAIKQDLQLVVGALVALAIVSAVRTLNDLRWLAGIALLVGTGMCMVALPSARQLDPSFGGAVVANRAHGIFTEPNQLGVFSAMLLMLACGVLIGARRRTVRTVAGMLATAALAALALSLSRGAWLGATLGVGGMIVLLPLAARRILAALLVGVVGLTAFLLVRPEEAALSVVGDRLKTLSNPTGNPQDARPAIYREALSEIIERPLTGFGPAGFQTASARPQSEVQTFGAFHAHNTLLTVAAEAGLPAALVLICFTLSVGLVTLRTVRRLRRHDGTRDAALVASLGAALLVVVGQGLVDYTLRHPVIVVFVWTVVGLVLAADRVSAAALQAPSSGGAHERRTSRGMVQA